MATFELSNQVKIAIYVLSSLCFLTFFIILLVVLRNHIGIPWKKSASSNKDTKQRHLDVENGYSYAGSEVRRSRSTSKSRGSVWSEKTFEEKMGKDKEPKWKPSSPSLELRGNRGYLLDGRGTEMPYEFSVSGYRQLFVAPPGKARLKAV